MRRSDLEIVEEVGQNAVASGVYDLNLELAPSTRERPQTRPEWRFTMKTDAVQVDGYGETGREAIKHGCRLFQRHTGFYLLPADGEASSPTAN